MQSGEKGSSSHLMLFTPQDKLAAANANNYIYKHCEPTLIDKLIVGADVSKKHTLNDTLNSNSSKYVNLL